MTKIYFSNKCPPSSYDEGICINYALVVLIAVLSTLAIILLAGLIIHHYERRRRAKRMISAARVAHNVDLEMHALSCHLPTSGLVPRDQDGTRNQIGVRNQNGGTRMPTGAGLQHSTSVRTVDTLPLYQEKMEDDPVAVKGALASAEEEGRMVDVDLGDGPEEAPRARDHFPRLYR